jgi:signal transduction histidine kinase/DNA-binding response OmpR family regulator/streptogramin lyase
MCGIDGQGIWEIDKKGKRVINTYKENIDNPYSLKGNGVYDILNDKESNRLWVCTISGGVSFFDHNSSSVEQITHQINNVNSLSNNEVNSVLRDSQGNIWFATNNGICCWDTRTNVWKSMYYNKKEQAQVFLSLCEDNQKRIWAGSYGSGVYVINEQTKAEVAHYADYGQGSFKFIFDIYKDKQDNIWIGGVQGNVVCFNTKENKFRVYGVEPVSSFYEYSSDKMLLSCSYGLVMLDKITGTVQTILQGYSLSDIIVLGNYVWFGTSGNGLIRYDVNKHSIMQFTVKSGLSSNFINSIVYQGGYLWLGTENGLCRFNPQNNKVSSFSFSPLANVSFNSNACYMLPNGQLLWGTNNGAILFYPNKLQQSKSKGKIYLQNLIISGKAINDQTSLVLNTPLDSVKSLDLRYYQNTFSLDVVKIGNYLSGSKFSWKLDGYDKEWSMPTFSHFITYTNIPEGTYLLKIRLYNSSLQTITERDVVIKVNPPFWKTWWFVILFLMMVSIFVYSFFVYYKEKLEKQHSEEKIKFFTNTTHDIRTLLTLINAPVEELNKEKNLSKNGSYYLKLATEQVRRMSTIANQLLDFQKMDIGKDKIFLQMVDIVSLVKRRITMFEAYALSKNVRLIFSSDQSEYVTAIDESKMEKVIDNLISNAIKYSISENNVYISLKSDKGNWTLEFKDQGIGINAQAQQKLFKEFYRADNAVNSKIVGSGIGLLLAKNIVMLHDGKISCSSQENVGSSFTITIPYKEVENKNVDENENQISRPAISVENTSLTPPVTKKELKLLIVEDNDDLREFMQHPLSEDFITLTAKDGEEAWKIIHNQMPDLVVSDIMMPNMNGFDLCKKLKSTYETSHIPIILLTALSEKTDQMQGLRLGADDYLTKPFDINLLIQRIKSIIRNRELVKDKTLKLIKEVSSAPIVSNEHNDKFIKKALEVVRLNIADSSFGKDEFASKMNVSTSLLYKKIKSLTDQSPTDFIKTVRLSYAFELLESRQYTVTEVSELCGFSSTGYFSTVFRKQYGKAPSDLLS